MFFAARQSCTKGFWAGTRRAFTRKLQRVFVARHTLDFADEQGVNETCRACDTGPSCANQYESCRFFLRILHVCAALKEKLDCARGELAGKAAR